jgi:methyl coenzyme M reductase alpha subunit|tara:strand:+ start:2308 stop:2601 length:294 start_codon:yes stop_codon:yes gene_type:complete
MPELQAHFDEFRVLLVRHIRELDARDPDSQSTEWYLLKYLRRVHRKTVVSTSPREVENTIRALIRFYLDGVDAGTPLEQRVKDVLAAHRRSLRLERR